MHIGDPLLFDFYSFKWLKKKKIDSQTKQILSFYCENEISFRSKQVPNSRFLPSTNHGIMVVQKNITSKVFRKIREYGRINAIGIVVNRFTEFK